MTDCNKGERWRERNDAEFEDLGKVRADMRATRCPTRSQVWVCKHATGVWMDRFKHKEPRTGLCNLVFSHCSWRLCQDHFQALKNDRKVGLLKESAYIRHVLHPKGMLPSIYILPRNKSCNYFKDIMLCNDFWQYIALGWRLIRAMLFERHTEENPETNIVQCSVGMHHIQSREGRDYFQHDTRLISVLHISVSEGKRETVSTLIIWDVPSFNIWDFWQWG